MKRRTPVTEHNSRLQCGQWADLVWDGTEIPDCGMYGPHAGYLHVPFRQDGELLRQRVRPKMRIGPGRRVLAERVDGAWYWVTEPTEGKV